MCGGKHTSRLRTPDTRTRLVQLNSRPDGSPTATRRDTARGTATDCAAGLAGMTTRVGSHSLGIWPGLPTAVGVTPAARGRRPGQDRVGECGDAIDGGRVVAWQFVCESGAGQVTLPVGLAARPEASRRLTHSPQRRFAVCGGGGDRLRQPRGVDGMAVGQQQHVGEVAFRVFTSPRAIMVTSFSARTVSIG